MSDNIISLKDVSVTFGSGKNAFRAVKNVSFDIRRGETFGLVGESGSGKTTIGRAILRIHPLSGGEIQFNDQRISGKIDRQLDKTVTQKIQMIFQDPMASLNERAKISYIVSEGLLNVRKGISKKEVEKAVTAALNDVGLLPEFSSRFPHEFSGGQRQRIGIARALATQPRFVVCDEPISALDVSIQAQVVNLLRELQKTRGLTYLFIAHDLSMVKYISDRIAVMCHGKIVEMGDSETVYNRPLHPYTQSLISAIPLPDPRSERVRHRIPYTPPVERGEWKLREVETGHFVYCGENGETA